MPYPRERFSFWLYRWKFPFGPQVEATTLPLFGIIYRQPEAEVPWTVRRHEAEHVAQWRRLGGDRLGAVAFYAIYLWQYFRALLANKWNAAAAYQAIPMEVAAYAAQTTTWPKECPDHPDVSGVPT